MALPSSCTALSLRRRLWFFWPRAGSPPRRRRASSTTSSSSLGTLLPSLCVLGMRGGFQAAWKGIGDHTLIKVIHFVNIGDMPHQRGRVKRELDFHIDAFRRARTRALGLFSNGCFSGSRGSFGWLSPLFSAFRVALGFRSLVGGAPLLSLSRVLFLDESNWDSSIKRDFNASR